MAIFIWNTRGINTKERRQDLKDQLYRLKPSFVGLVETKVKEHNSFRITEAFHRIGVLSTITRIVQGGGYGLLGILLYGIVKSLILQLKKLL